MRGRGALFLAFACSGAAALIYETAWTRLLTLFMGHTVAAVSTVLAAFMGGLAVGAAVGGRLASRLSPAHALLGYAIVEVLIAICAIALPFEITALRPLLAAAYADGDGGALFGLTRLMSSLLVVAIPAAAMGATLPLVVRWDIGKADAAGQESGLLYAANTLGAAMGAVLSGFVLLPAIGVRLTTTVGVVLNGISAVVAWWLSRRVLPEAIEPAASDVRTVRNRRDRTRNRETPAVETVPTAVWSIPSSRLVPALALAISGCASLMLQIAWTRILALVIGPTTYAFSAMVATFIAGIALGSFAGGFLAKRGRSRWTLSVALVAGALAAAGATAYAPRVPLVLAAAVALPDASFASVVRLQSAVIAGLMMPMTVAFGAAFPLAVSLAAQRNDTIVHDVALVYTANTFGAILGALLAGFVVVPRLGLQNAVQLAATLAVAASVLVVVAVPPRRKSAMLAAALAIVAATILWRLPPWDRELLSSGAYKYAPYLSARHRDALLRAGTLLYYREGATAVVSVRKLAGTLSLAIDGKVDASNAGDMLTQKLLAHIPLLLHPAPKHVGIIGLGSGVTLGAALRHPVQSVDTLEISPEVVEASAFFRRENHDALADPRTRLILGDGRSHLLLGRQTYDVIVSEPSNPWMAGVAALFTREFFEAARGHLAWDGILCQWAHTYDISPIDLRSIVATFVSVLPHSSLWLVGDGDILLIGSRTPIESRLESVFDNWNRPGVAGDLAEVDVGEPSAVLSLFTASEHTLQRYGQTASVQRDDRLALEFSAPRAIYGRTTIDNMADLRTLTSDAKLPDVVRRTRERSTTWTVRGRMELRAEAYRSAFIDFARAVAVDPDNQAALEGLLEAAAPSNRIADAEHAIRGIVDRRPQSVPARVTLSKLLAARNELDAAANALRTALTGPAPDVRAMTQLASVFVDAGDRQALSALLADLQRLAPEADDTLYYSASLRFMENRLPDAIATAERLRARNPRHAKCLNLLGAAYATLGRIDDGRRAFRASLDADPRDATTYTNLGTLELRNGRAALASEYFAEALTLDPSSTAAEEGLTEALALNTS
jgi:spermidine synthase